VHCILEELYFVLCRKYTLCFSFCSHLAAGSSKKQPYGCICMEGNPVPVDVSLGNAFFWRKRDDQQPPWNGSDCVGNDPGGPK